MCYSPGEEVICVDASPGYCTGEPSNLVEGSTYVVLEALSKEHGNFKYGPWVRVHRQRLWLSHKRFRRPRVDEERSEVKQIERA